MTKNNFISIVASAALIGNFAFADAINDGDTFDASDWKSSTNIKVVDSTAGSVEMNISATDVDNDTLNINAGDSESAILDWTKLDVDSDKYLKFGGDDTIYLNKVSGDDASDLLGTITDDGSSTVIIVNPNGINVGSEANIEVEELFLSTEDFVRYDGDDIDDNASKLGVEFYGFDTDDNTTNIVIENGADINTGYLVLVDDGGKIEINASIEAENVIAINRGEEGDENYTIASSDVIIDENGTLQAERMELDGKSITIKNDINASDELTLATTGGDIVTENNATIYTDYISIGYDDLNTTGDVNIQTETSGIEFTNTKNIYITNNGSLELDCPNDECVNNVEGNLTINLTNDYARFELDSNLTAGDTITLDNIHYLYLNDNEINATTLNISTDRYIYFEDYNSDGYFYFDEDRLNQLNVKNLTFTTTEGIKFYDDTNLTKFDSVTLNALDDPNYEDNSDNYIYIGSYDKVTANKLTLNTEDYINVYGDINATNLNIKTDYKFYQSSSYDSRIDVNETLKIEGSGYVDLNGEVNAKDIDLNTTNYINFDGDITAENILANTTNNININNDLVADNVELNADDITIGSYDSITANNIKLNANDDIDINGDITAENIDIKAGDLLSLDSYYSNGIEANNTINIVTNRLDVDEDISAKNITLDVNDTRYYTSSGTFIADEMNITAHDEAIKINDIDSKNINLNNVKDITFNKLSSEDNITISGNADRISINSNDYNDNIITINNDKNLELGKVYVSGDLIVNNDENLTITDDLTADNVSLVADNIDMNEVNEYYYTNNISVDRLDVNASSVTLKNVNVTDSVNVYNGENGIDIEMTGYDDTINIIDAKEATVRGGNVDVNFLVDDNITLDSQIDNLSITANHNVTINDLGNYGDEYYGYNEEGYYTYMTPDLELKSLNNNNESLTITSQRDVQLNTDVNVSSLTIDTTGDLVSSGYDIISDNIDINASKIGYIDGEWNEYYDYDDDEYKSEYDNFYKVSSIHLKTNDDAKVVLHSAQGIIAVDTNGSITLDNISFEDGGKLYVDAPTINLSQDFNDTDVKVVASNINFNQEIGVNDLVIVSGDNIDVTKKIISTGKVSLLGDRNITISDTIEADNIEVNADETLNIEKNLTASNDISLEAEEFNFKADKISADNNILVKSYYKELNISSELEAGGDINIDTYDDVTISKNITAEGDVNIQTSYDDIILDANITGHTISLSTDRYVNIDENMMDDPYLGEGLDTYVDGRIIQKSGILHSTATYGEGLVLTSHTIGDENNHLVYKSDDDWANENVIVNLGKLDNSSALYLDSNITESDFDSNRDYASWIVFNKLESPSLDFNLSFYDNQENEINDGILDFDATALNSIRYDSLYTQDFVNIARLQEDVTDIKDTIGDGFDSENTISKYIGYIVNGSSSVADINATDFFENGNNLATNLDLTSIQDQLNYNTAKIEALADYKVDGSSVTLDDYKNNTSIFDSTDLVIELKEAVDASNAKASKTALSDVADTVDTLEEENNQGSLFVDFFKKLFGDS